MESSNSNNNNNNATTKATTTGNSNNKGNTNSGHHHGMLTRFQLLLLFLMVIQNSCTVLIGRYTRNPTIPKHELYKVNHLIMISEITKFVLSCLLEHIVQSSSASSSSLLQSIHQHILDNIFDTCKVLIPALLYIVQTSLLYVALSNLTAPIFQVTYQMKLVTTALLSVLMLPNRSYNVRQWICLILLSIGVSIVVLGEQKQQQKQDTNHNEQNFILGLTSVISGAFSSALAGVYFEKVLKTAANDKKGLKDIDMNNRNNISNDRSVELVPLMDDTTSSTNATTNVDQGKVNTASAITEPTLWMRNIQLSFFSILLAATQNAYQNYKTHGDQAQQEKTTTIQEESYFHGFTMWVWALVFFQAGGGLLVAAIIKYADNVVKGLASGVSIIVATLFSIIASPDSRSQMNFQFLLGSILILGSVYYFSNPFPTTSSIKPSTQ